MKRVIFNVEAEFLVKNEDYERIMEVTQTEMKGIAKAIIDETRPKRGRIKRFEFISVKGKE